MKTLLSSKINVKTDIFPWKAKCCHIIHHLETSKPWQHRANYKKKSNGFFQENKKLGKMEERKNSKRLHEDCKT